MSKTLTIRLSDDLTNWLHDAASRSGVPAGRIVREQLEKLRAATGDRPFLRRAGEIEGPPDLSSRKGFSRP